MARIATVALAFAVLLIAAAAAQSPSPPAAITGGATGVGPTGATLAGSVNPNGTATTYRFEYGTTARYGLSTAERSAGAGRSSVAVSQPVSRLTAATVYHYRIVATNAAGIARGADRSFRTAPAPSAPFVATGGALQVTSASATLAGTVVPRGQAGNYHFEWGPTPRLGRATAKTSYPAGPNVSARAGILGLQPGARYYFRLVARNATGITRGVVRTFVSTRGPGGATIAVSPEPTTFGSSATVSGRLIRGTVANVAVALQRQRFPFLEQFRTSATQRSARDGSFKFATGPLFAATRFRVVASGVASRLVTVRNRVKVGMIVRRRPGRKLRVYGTIAPRRRASWTVSLQRLSPSGRWVRLKRVKTRGLDANRSRYRTTTVRPRRRARISYRVVVTPRGEASHVRGYSRAVATGRR